MPRPNALCKLAECWRPPHFGSRSQLTVAFILVRTIPGEAWIRASSSLPLISNGLRGALEGKEGPTTLSTQPLAITCVAVAVAGVPVVATAQTTAADPHHPDTTVAQATPPSGTMGPGMMGQSPGAQPGQTGMMGGMMQSGMMGMPGPRMKIMFAIADVNGDGALSFDEVTALHKRIFDRIDANKDGKVTPEELQAFMRESS